MRMKLRRVVIWFEKRDVESLRETATSDGVSEVIRRGLVVLVYGNEAVSPTSNAHSRAPREGLREVTKLGLHPRSASPPRRISNTP